jgi:predicted AAA+ superfamily ATPase
MHIPRILEAEVLEFFGGKASKGLILSGIVGCGKTTLIQRVLETLKDHYSVFSFTSDDVQFRAKLIEDTTFLYHHVRSQTTGRVLIFIDEVQKCEEVFDAIKYAFDQGNISFIVSGSNPAYLNTSARKRLQRRAQFLMLHPLSLFEILSHEKKLPAIPYQHLVELFSGDGFRWIKNLPAIELTKPLQALVASYGEFGGLPLAWLAEGKKSKLQELQTVAERGFSPASEEADAFSDIARVAMAELNSREFTYTTIFQKTRTTKRHKVNAVIDELINHGYIFKKTPHLFHSSKISYLFVLSWVDPGLVHYYQGASPWGEVKGFTIESMVHTALVRMAGLLPLKTAVHYYKPYSIDANDKVKYQPGEIDFLFQVGAKFIPIEVKATADIQAIDTSLLKQVIKTHRMDYGIVCYGGVPHIDTQARIIYWPYWWL